MKLCNNVFASKYFEHQIAQNVRIFTFVCRKIRNY